MHRRCCLPGLVRMRACSTRGGRDVTRKLFSNFDLLGSRSSWSDQGGLRCHDLPAPASIAERVREPQHGRRTLSAIAAGRPGTSGDYGGVGAELAHADLVHHHAFDLAFSRCEGLGEHLLPGQDSPGWIDHRPVVRQQPFDECPVPRHPGRRVSAPVHEAGSAFPPLAWFSIRCCMRSAGPRRWRPAAILASFNTLFTFRRLIGSLAVDQPRYAEAIDDIQNAQPRTFSRAA